MITPSTSYRSSRRGADSIGFSCYDVYGLRVQSEVRLPLAPEVRADPVRVDCRIRRTYPGDLPTEPDGRVVKEVMCHEPCHGGRAFLRITRGPHGTWFWFDSVGTFHVAPDARLVNVYAHPGRDEPTLGLVLVAQVLVFVLHQLGFPSLHASAVEIRDGVLAFLGPVGRGKSTLASFFLPHGAKLVTDDVLPLKEGDDGVYAVPSLPLLKLATLPTDFDGWHPHAERPSWLRSEKMLLAVDTHRRFASSPGRIHAVYVLDRREPSSTDDSVCTIEPLSGVSAISALLCNTRNDALLDPSEHAMLLPLYARLATHAPIRILRYTSGFAHRDVVYAGVIADLEGR